MPEIIFKFFPIFLNILFLLLSVSYLSRTFSTDKGKPFASIIGFVSGCILLGIAFVLVDKGFLRLILFAFALFLFTFSYKMHLFIRFLMTVAVYAIVSASDFVSLIIICSAFSLPVEATLVEPVYTLGIIFSFSITFIVLFIIKHTRSFIAMGTFDKRFLLIYLLPLCTTIVIITEYAVFCNCDTSFQINMIMLSGALLLLITNFIIFTLTDALFMQIEAEKKLQIAKEMIEKQSEEYRKLLNTDGEIRRYRHDVKNFLSGVLFNLEEDKTDLVKTSVKMQLDSFKDFDKYASSKNALNALLAFKEENSPDIKFSYEINVKESYSFNDIDLAVLLGNLIDNAVEATEKVITENKWVNVKIFYEGTAMHFIVTNPVKDKPNTLNLITTKKNKKEHGLGLLSVKSLAEKYNGNVAFSCNDMVFKAVVILYEKD